MDGMGMLDLAVTARTRYRFVCRLAGRIVWTEDFPNLVTTAGLEYLLRRGLLGQTLPTFNDGGLDAVNGRRYPDGRRVPRVWTTGTKAVGDLCQPTTPNGRMYLCITGGASGGSEPSFPATDGATVADGSATWLEGSLLYLGFKGSGAPMASDRMNAHASWSEVTGYDESARQAFHPASATSGSTNNSAAVASFTFTTGATVTGAFLCDHPTKGGSNGLLYGVGDLGSPRVVPNGGVLDVTATPSVS
jgi:hypothetical protein